MDDHIDSMIDRMDLHQIIGFIQFGTETLKHEDLPYTEQLRCAKITLNKHLEELCDDGCKLEHAKADLSKLLLVYETVYMELGMKAGARLVCQMVMDNHF